MRNVIVLIPTPTESRFVIDRGIRVEHCGVGAAACGAATAKLIVEGKPDLIILAGTAGAYTDNLEIGETVAVKSETTAALGRLSENGNGHEFTPLYQKTYISPVVPNGYKAVRSNTVPTAGGFIVRPVDADIENMEGAAFLAVCAALGVPAMEVRTVSNMVGGGLDKRNMEISASRLAIELEAILNSLPDSAIFQDAVTTEVGDRKSGGDT